MDALRFSFVNGETIVFPFCVGSTVAVDTPDGVNGSQRGVWGEIVGVEYVKDTGEPTETPVNEDAPVEQQPVENEPVQSEADAATDAPADAPADDVPAA